MEAGIATFVKAYTTCQRFGKQRKKYGKVPHKTVNMIPWETVCIDLVGPCTFTDKSGTD